MEETAYAKINLALHVLGRRPDGYHDIDTVFAFAEDGDRLRVEPEEGLSLVVSGRFAADIPAGDDNLVLRAALALGSGKGARLSLDKRLPVASGIGGGSADAAAALRLLNRWWGLGLDEDRLVELARPLGADVPACVLSRPVRGEGIGNELSRVDAPSGTPLLLVNPGVALPTAAVFGRWRGIETGRNDLEPPAREIAPVVGEVLDRLRRQPGVRVAGMSGSGATCFALFDSAAARDQAVLPTGWWRLPSRLR